MRIRKDAIYLTLANFTRSLAFPEPVVYKHRVIHKRAIFEPARLVAHLYFAA